jgi:hypothetical protein
MTRVYARLAAEALRQVMQGASATPVTTHELDGRVALFGEPVPDRLESILPYGLARRLLAQGPAVIELFHTAPSIPDLLRSLRRGLELRSPAAWPPRPGEPWVWIFCGERPNGAFSKFGLDAERGFPRGIYATPSAYRLRLVVPNELPRTLDTLFLRLLGTGKPLRGALSELDELAPDHAVAKLMVPLVLRLNEECQGVCDREAEAFERDTRAFCEARRARLGAK